MKDTCVFDCINFGGRHEGDGRASDSLAVNPKLEPRQRLLFCP